MGQIIYQPFITLGQSCVPRTLSELLDCVTEYPQVNTGMVSGVLPRQGAMGSYFTSQTDLPPGSSGSPGFVFVDNGDAKINVLDFKLIGINNTVWSASGNNGQQAIYAGDLSRILAALQNLQEIWEAREND